MALRVLRRVFCARVDQFLAAPVSHNRSLAQQRLEGLFAIDFYALDAKTLATVLERLNETAHALRGEDKATKLAFRIIPALLLQAQSNPLPISTLLRLLNASLPLRICNPALIELIFQQQLRGQSPSALIQTLKTLLHLQSAQKECLVHFDQIEKQLGERAERVNGNDILPLLYCAITREILREIQFVQKKSTLPHLFNIVHGENDLAHIQLVMMRARDRVLERWPGLAQHLVNALTSATIGKRKMGAFLKFLPLLIPEVLPQLGKDEWSLPRLSSVELRQVVSRSAFLDLLRSSLFLTRKMSEYVLHRQGDSDFLQCFADRSVKINSNEERIWEILKDETALSIEKNVLLYFYEIDLLIGHKNALEVDSHAHSFFLMRPDEQPIACPDLVKAFPRALTLRFLGVERQFSFLSREFYQQARQTGKYSLVDYIYENIITLPSQSC